MRAKEVWALVPVPSHVIKKVVSPCPDYHVNYPCIPNLLGILVPTILGYHRQVQAYSGIKNASVKAVNPCHYCHQSFDHSLPLSSASVLTLHS